MGDFKVNAKRVPLSGYINFTVSPPQTSPSVSACMHVTLKSAQLYILLPLSTNFVYYKVHRL